MKRNLENKGLFTHCSSKKGGGVYPAPPSKKGGGVYPAPPSKKGGGVYPAPPSKKGGAGFTLIELLIVIGILAILAGIVIVAVNPARQFAMANNSRRSADITTILNAVSQNIIENRGIWTCLAGSLPATSTNMANDGYDICACLVPTYIAEMPADPTAGSYIDCADYNTGYSISQDPLTGRVAISAPAAQSENGDPPDISIIR